MLISVSKFIKNVMKAKIEGIFAIAAVLLILFMAITDPVLSASIAAVLLLALGIYEFVRRQKQERGYLNVLSIWKEGSE
jgi:O-antigen/teichoic acid export membrane protein